MAVKHNMESKIAWTSTRHQKSNQNNTRRSKGQCHRANNTEAIFQRERNSVIKLLLRMDLNLRKKKVHRSSMDRKKEQ
jgi:hypothetical protein